MTAEQTLERFNLAEAPQLTVTVSLVAPPSAAADGIERPRTPKFFLKLKSLFHPHHRVEESKGPLLEAPVLEEAPKAKAKTTKFLHSLFGSPPRNGDSITSDLSIKSINEEELQVIKERIPDKATTAELSFSTKYRFENEKVIGRGASGVVRLGVLLADQAHKVAVKEFRKRRKSETHQQYLVKLTAEYMIASKLHHPNIIETIDIVHDGKKWFEIMEFCPGGDLFSAIQNNDLGVDEVDSAFFQIVQGVAYLHSLGIAHRDLKPENMLIDCAGLIRIGDFGVSELLQQDSSSEASCLRMSHGVCGSSPYIAPEEFTDQDYDARAVDVWAMAIIYFTMAFHTIPWQMAQMTDPCYSAYVRRGSKCFEPFKRMSYGARSLLKKMLEPDPTKRVTIQEILKDEWFSAIGVCPIKHIERRHRHDFNFVAD